MVPACVQCLCVPCLCAGAPPPLPLSGHGCVSCNLSPFLSSLPPVVYLLPLPRWTSSGYRAPPLARHSRSRVGSACARAAWLFRRHDVSVSRVGVQVCGVRRAPGHPVHRTLGTAPSAPRPSANAAAVAITSSLQHHRVSLSDANSSRTRPRWPRSPSPSPYGRKAVEQPLPQQTSDANPCLRRGSPRHEGGGRGQAVTHAACYTLAVVPSGYQHGGATCTSRV